MAMSVLIHRLCHNSFETGRYERVVDEEHFANETQLAKLEELGLTESYVVVHEKLSRFVDGEHIEDIQHWMLVEDWTNRRALYILPDGETQQASTPYPWCIGNPYRATCAAVGTCRRNPTCGD